MASSSAKNDAPTGRQVKMEKDFKAGEGANYYEGELTETEEKRILMFHDTYVGQNQTKGVIYKEIHASAASVWRFLRRFDQPQAYKEFVTDCLMASGDGVHPGSIRHITVKPELPGKDSFEELVTLDEENHVICFKIISGEHKLHGYKATTTVAERELTTGQRGSLVIESYVVDVPDGHSEEDTNTLVHTLIRANLLSLDGVVRAYNEHHQTF